MTQKLLTWSELAMIEIGGAICLPVIMVGHAIAKKVGISYALLSIVLGNGVLLLLALISASLSVNRRAPTPEQAKNYFGELGARGFAATLLFSKLCWFAIQLHLISLSLGQAFPTLLPLAGWDCLLGTMIILCALTGIQGIGKIAKIATPLMVGTMGYAACRAYFLPPVETLSLYSGEGISMAIAAAITAVIDMPTYFRHARSHKEARRAVIAFIGIAVPLIEGLGIYLFSKSGGSEIVTTLTSFGGRGWEIWIALFILLAGWTTNNTNLYSAVNCARTLFPKCSEKLRTLICGSVAVAASLAGITAHFSLILQLIGIGVGSMGLVILSSYALEKYAQTSILRNCLAWGLGLLGGILSAFHWIEITGIPLLDGGIIALGAALVFLKRNYETA
jgi:cytosine permease